MQRGFHEVSGREIVNCFKKKLKKKKCSVVMGEAREREVMDRGGVKIHFTVTFYSVKLQCTYMCTCGEWVVDRQLLLY